MPGNIYGTPDDRLLCHIGEQDMPGAGMWASGEAGVGK